MKNIQLICPIIESGVKEILLCQHLFGMVFLAVALNILEGGRDLQVRIADPSAIPGL